jgi:hypothetical protein
MESAVRALLSNRAINVRPFESNVKSTVFSCIGIAEKIAHDSPKMNGEVYLWHVASDLLPLSKNEIERWIVDVPVGNHWVLSEREVPSEIPKLENYEIVLWGPEMVSEWLGNAILRGDLVAKPPQETNDPEKSPSIKEIKQSRPTTLRSKIDFSIWITQRGLDGTNSTPVLLEARLWEVEGNLIGPAGQNESHSWFLFEDPWSLNLELLDESKSTQNTPELRIIKPEQTMWMAEERLQSEAERILEVRRKEDPIIGDINGPVRSMLLRKWEFNSQTASFAPSPAYIPGWILHLPDKSKILHGVNGRLYDVP